MGNELVVGVVGAGRIGTLHAQNLMRHIPRVRVKTVADPRLVCAQAAAATSAAEHVTDDYRQVIDDPGIDAVIIASSTNTHTQIIVEAAARGKHIFCEKPIDHDVQRIREAIAAVQQAGVAFHVGFNRRFDPDFRRLADQVRHGKIGVPHLVRITSRDPEPPTIDYIKVSGGLFMDMSIHDLDMARFLVPEEIVEVYATGSGLVDPAIAAAGDIDTAVIVLRYASGAVCTIDNSRQARYGYDQRLEVFGSNGCLLAANNTPTRVSLWNEYGQQNDRPHYFFLERYRDSYIAEMQDFVDAIRHRRPASVSGVDGLQAVLLAQAARKSLVERRAIRMEGVAEPVQAA